ncbi:MAG: hypothetical protein M1277_00325 [Patescibacteria group bacterium]|nr:hypothetical protein [Patescibacteria group bacterium]
MIYAILHLDHNFLNPFVFFLFPYFPGFSLFGALVGAFVFIFVYFKPPKNPRLRLLDFFSASFLFAYTGGFIITIIIFLFSQKYIHFIDLVELLFLCLLSIFLLLYLLPKEKRGELQDGSVGFIFYALFVPILFLRDQAHKIMVLGVNIENIFSVILFFTCVSVFAKRERVLSRVVAFLKLKIIRKNG